MAKNTQENNPADIVIAEDSPVQLETLKYVLEKNGHRVRSGTNGKQALDLIQSAPPDLVISDVIMPVMNGFELSREIRKNPAYDHIPVILLTSLTDTQDVALALESGADSFLTKPFNPDYLELRIRQILSPEHKMRARDTDKNSVAVSSDGTVYHIASDRGQMFEFLLTAYQVAIMKQREVTQAEEKLRKTNENISDLNTIISICNSSLSAQEMFDLLIKTIVEVLEFEFGAIYLFNDDRTSADLQYYYELIPVHDSFLDLLGRLDPNASRNADVFVNGKCGFFDLTRDSPYGEREKLIFEAMGAKAYVILPVKSADQILGAVVLLSTSEHSFATNETGLIESVGREVGSAVKRLLLQRRIETANEEMNLYLDIMTHDINNVVFGSALYAELLSGELTGPHKEMLQRIMTNFSHTNEIITNVSTIRRLHENRAKLTPMDLDAVIRNQIGHFTGVRFIYAGTTERIYADDLISQVFTNLIGNSLKFSDTEAEITIEVTVKGDFAEVSVSDNGPGIPDDFKPLVFDRFRKGTSKKSGKGLGLFITKYLVDAYGGEIWATDRVPGDFQKGASIHFTLKRASSPAGATT